VVLAGIVAAAAGGPAPETGPPAIKTGAGVGAGVPWLSAVVVAVGRGVGTGVSCGAAVAAATRTSVFACAVEVDVDVDDAVDVEVDVVGIAWIDTQSPSQAIRTRPQCQGVKNDLNWLNVSRVSGRMS
jgi:hypothetical protein